MPEDTEPAAGETSSDLRASDADRDHVVAQLRDALAAGLINADEFHERSQQALTARTLGDLAPLVRDLPAGDAQELAGRGDVVELRGTFSSIKRSGNWAVPRQLRLRQRMASAELDLTQAEISYPVISVDLDVSGGSVEIRLPDGASAATDGVSVVLGSVQDHRRDASPDGTPRFVFTGAIRWGSLELRGPRAHLFGQR